jgi:hypothetical protein
MSQIILDSSSDYLNPNLGPCPSDCLYLHLPPTNLNPLDYILSPNLSIFDISNHKVLVCLSYIAHEWLVDTPIHHLKLGCITTKNVVNCCPTSLDLIAAASH